MEPQAVGLRDPNQWGSSVPDSVSRALSDEFVRRTNCSPVQPERLPTPQPGGMPLSAASPGSSGLHSWCATARFPTRAERLVR